MDQLQEIRDKSWPKRIKTKKKSCEHLKTADSWYQEDFIFYLDRYNTLWVR